METNEIKKEKIFTYEFKVKKKTRLKLKKLKIHFFYKWQLDIYMTIRNILHYNFMDFARKN